MSGLSPAEIIGRSLRRAKYIAEQESQCWRRYPILRCCKRQAGDHRKKKRNKEFELLWKMAADSVHPRGGESYRQIRRNRNREAGLGGTVVKATVQKGSSVSRGALNTV